MTPRRTALTAAALVTPALIASMLLIPAPASADSDKPTFSFTGRYYNGGSEVSAILGNRMYVINGLGIDIVDISNPAAPAKLTTIDLSAYGGTITSVATSRRHVAVAVPKAGEGNAKGDPGTVVILDPQGTVLATALVGALPDMVTFDEDGKRVLVANEGEPVRYVANADGPVIDPVGSVSIISLKGLDKGDDRCEVDEDDDRDDDKDDDRDDDKDDDRRPAAQDREDDDDREDDRGQQAAQDREDDDDSREGRGTRSRDDDDRKDDRRPVASPVATTPSAPASAAAVPVKPASEDKPSSDNKACDDDDPKGDDDRDDNSDRERDDDESRKDRPSTTPSTGTPTAEATPAVAAVVPAAPVVLTATTVGFTDFNVGGPRGAELSKDVRIFGPGATVAQDLEPEYITVAGDRAFVTLQENNAIAEIDIESASVVAIRPLALKDHSLDGNGLDPSDRDLAPAFTAGTIAIAKWPVRGMPMPDGIDSFTVKGRTYLITANEGDARQDWPGYQEEVRVGNGSYVLNADVFTNAAALKANQALGRLTVSKATGNTNSAVDGFEEIHAFGTRSVTIWGTDGTRVWDSGDQIEQRVKEADQSPIPLIFNSTNDAANSFDTRSDNKGPEPEGVVVGKVDGRMLAFVGLERPGGFMVFDVSDPSAPVWLQYATNRDFAAAPSATNDSGPEVLRFVPAEDSPSGDPLVVVSNEISGTVAIWSAKD